MAKNFHVYVILGLLSHSSRKINPMDYHLWGVVKNDINSHPYNAVTALSAAVVYVIANVPNTYLIIACSQYLQCVETVIAAGGGFSESCHPQSMCSSVKNVKT